MFLGGRDEIDSWKRYLDDIKNATDEIFIDIPGLIDDDEEALKAFGKALEEAEKRGVSVCLRVESDISLGEKLDMYSVAYPYVTTPMTMIDKRIIWFGEPLSSADFISEGEVVETKHFPCMRFVGKHTARMLKAIFEIPTF